MLGEEKKKKKKNGIESDEVVGLVNYRRREREEQNTRHAHVGYHLPSILLRTNACNFNHTFNIQQLPSLFGLIFSFFVRINKNVS